MRLEALVLAGLGGMAWGQAVGSVEVREDRTKPGVEFAPVATVSARGVQIYRCGAAAKGGWEWVFVAPEATLSSEALDGGVVGRHGAGPSWQWVDGSAVKGVRVEVKQAAPGEAIPWLLVRVEEAPGSKAGGSLSGVVYVRRAETVGGVAPSSGCDAAHERSEARVPYTARYTFYRGQ